MKNEDSQVTLSFHNAERQVTIAVPEHSMITWMDYVNNLFVPMLRAALDADMSRLADSIYEEYGYHEEHQPTTISPEEADKYEESLARVQAWVKGEGK